MDRQERLLKPPVVADQERFVARPTKVIPSVLKLVKAKAKPGAKARPAEAPRRPQQSPQLAVSEPRAAVKIKKPISAFKSVPATTVEDTEDEDTDNIEDNEDSEAAAVDEDETPVYIPRYLLLLSTLESFGNKLVKCKV